MKEKNADEIINRIVEEPLRKACKELRRKGIETIMSSANKKNLLSEGEKAIEKEDVKGKEFLLDAPTFESADKGYAWIMINFTTLTDENKQMLFSLEEVKDSKGYNIGEKIVWFVKGSFFLHFWHIIHKDDTIRSYLDEKFDERSFFLQYNDRYPRKAVFLRMPLNSNTTVLDVERYFEKLIDKFKEQQLYLSEPDLDRE